MTCGVSGYSKMYYWPSEGGGVPGMVLSGLLFLLWTDCFVYWIHRFLHTFVALYKHIHKVSCAGLCFFVSVWDS